MNVNLVFLLLAAVHGALCGYADESGSLEKKSIVNGYNARRDYKFYVLINACDRPNSDDCSFCGGSMIRDKTVLTAAHCIEYRYPYLTVEAGDFTDRYSRKQIIRVRNTKVHNRWNPNDKNNRYDIALLYLSEKPRNRSPIRLCTHFEYSRYDINVIGMGATRGGDSPPNFPDVLQQVRLRESEPRYCEGTDENIQICLTGYGKDSCGGDSGGPAFPEKSNICLYGIVSYGSFECDGWGVYTRVPAFKDWIEQNA